MPKKTIIIFIVVFTLVGAGIFGYYYFTNQQKKATETNTGTTGYPSFNPFGGGTTTTTTGDTATVTDNTVPVTENVTPLISRFHKITDFAVAGATYFEDTKLIPESTPVVTTPTPEIVTPKKTTTKKAVAIKNPTPKYEIIPSLRYVERKNGHIYQMPLDTKISTKISNSTIPSIYEAFFDSKGSSVLYRYLSTDEETINTYLATLGSTKGGFLVTNIIDMTLSPDKNKLFYLTKNSNGVNGTIKSLNETKSSALFNSPFTEWLSQWATDQKIFLTTKASYSSNGSLFSLNTTNGILTKVFGGVKGLTTLVNNNGTLVLYNVSTNTGPKLVVFDINKRKNKYLDVYGLPEKCIWAGDNVSIYCALPKTITGTQYPDYWYQGLVSFDDYFVKINTNTNTTTTISDSTTETPVDATKLFLNKSENQLMFTNKKDYTLWSLDIL